MQLTKHLDLQSLLVKKDQEAFDEIINNDIYQSFYYASTENK